MFIGRHDIEFCKSVTTSGICIHDNWIFSIHINDICLKRRRQISSLQWFTGLPGTQFNIKMISYEYRKSHCGDKTILRLSYLHNGISYTGKMISLYWIRAKIVLDEWQSARTSPHFDYCPLVQFFTIRAFAKSELFVLFWRTQFKITITVTS